MKTAILSTAFAVGVVAAARSGPGPYDRAARINPKVQWYTCPSGTGDEYDCGTLDVPLDYADHSKGKARLAIARYNATVQPNMGLLFLNPGGPGGSGVDYVLNGGASLADTYLGNAYDVISWDPRGVGLTYPKIDCFDGETEEASFWSKSDSWNGMEVHGNFTSDDDSDPDSIAFWKEEPLMDKLFTDFGQKCLKLNGDNLEFVGSAAGVRDMLSISEALVGPNKDINFWGFSYGTILGAYLVNMFPDHVGRVIVDGVINPFVWSQQPAHHVWANSIIDIDKLVKGFAGACALAGPRTCAIAGPQSTEASVLKWIKDLLDALYDYKKAGGVIGSGDVTGLIFGHMYRPKSWGELASTLYAVASEIYNTTDSSSSTLDTRSLVRRQDDDLADTAFHAITCADAIDAGNITTRDIFQSVIETGRKVSQMFAANLGDPGFFCHKWPARAVERYSGPFNRVLKNPMIVIGNEFDPITPFAGAKALADALGDSAYLVMQDDYGHCSTASHSDCTISIINKFFVNGTYPKDNKFCVTDQVLFEQPAVTKERLANNNAVVDASFDPNVPVPGSEQSSNSAAAGAGISMASLHDEIEALKSTKQSLVLAVGALGAMFLLALVALVVALVRGRRKGAKYSRARDTMPVRESFETIGNYGDGGKGYKDHN